MSATASPADQTPDTSRSKARLSATSRSGIAYRIGWLAAQLFAKARTLETSPETVMAASHVGDLLLETAAALDRDGSRVTGAAPFRPRSRRSRPSG